MARRSPSDLPRRTVLAAGLAAACLPARAGAGRVAVFAAASLKPPLDEIAAGWDGPVSLSYAASGTLARQVAAGAPADVVILAATDWMDWLGEQGALDGPPVVLASNRLAMIGPTGAAPLELAPGPVLARLGDGRLAIGDPASVPAGRYAREALEALGLWEAVEPRLLTAADARAALAYVAGGEAPLGVAYASDAAGGVATVAAIPPEAHSPIAYPAALVRGAGPDAAAFLGHAAAASAIFATHGFAP